MKRGWAHNLLAIHLPAASAIEKVGTRSTEGGRKVFRVSEPASRIQTTWHPTPPITAQRASRRWSEGGQLIQKLLRIRPAATPEQISRRVITWSSSGLGTVITSARD